MLYLKCASHIKKLKNNVEEDQNADVE